MFKFLAAITLVFLITSMNSFANDSQKQLDSLLQQHKGEVIYVDFWASWCAPCRQSFPWLNEMQSKFKGLKVISINLDQKKQFAEKFLEETPANFSIIYDPKGKLAKQFKVRGMPSSYIFNKQGKIVSAHIGFTDAKKKQYEEELQELLSN